MKFLANVFEIAGWALLVGGIATGKYPYAVLGVCVACLGMVCDK